MEQTPASLGARQATSPNDRAAQGQLLVFQCPHDTGGRLALQKHLEDEAHAVSCHFLVGVFEHLAGGVAGQADGQAQSQLTALGLAQDCCGSGGRGAGTVPPRTSGP